MNWISEKIHGVDHISSIDYWTIVTNCGKIWIDADLGVLKCTMSARRLYDKEFPLAKR